MLCSVLYPVIVMILSLDTPGFWSFLTVLFRTLISEMLLVMSRPPIVATFFMKPSISLLPTGWMECQTSFWEESLQISHWVPQIWCSRLPLCDTPIDFSKSCLPCFCGSFNPLHILSGSSTNTVDKLHVFYPHLMVFLASPGANLLTDQVKYSWGSEDQLSAFSCTNPALEVQ